MRLIIDKGSFESQIKEWAENEKRLQPVELGSRSRYAFDTEFGSSGLVGTQHSNSGKRYNKRDEEYEALKKEIAKAYGKSGADLEKMAQAVKRSRVAFGQVPDPYMRPALHEVLHEVAMDKNWLTTHSTEDLAIMILDRMKRILKENRTLFAEDIERGMFHGPEGSSNVMSHRMGTVSKEALDSDTSRWDGSESNGRKSPSEGRI